MGWLMLTLISLGAVGLVVTIFLIATTVRKKKSGPEKNLLGELDSLKDKGLITEQEYSEKRADILNRSKERTNE